MFEIDYLYKLQTLYDSKKRFEKAKNNLLEELLNKKEEITKISEYITNESEIIKDLKVKLSKLSLEHGDLTKKIDNEEKKITMVRNDKEYEALQKNIAKLRTKADDIELEQMEYMETLDNKNIFIENKKSQKQEKTDKLKSFLSRCKTDISNIELEIENLISEIEDIREKISKNSLRLFDQKMEENGCAVVEVDTDSICSNCRLGIVKGKIGIISKGVKYLEKCSNCGRFLFWTGPVND